MNALQVHTDTTTHTHTQTCALWKQQKHYICYRDYKKYSLPPWMFQPFIAFYKWSHGEYGDLGLTWDKNLRKKNKQKNKQTLFNNKKKADFYDIMPVN